MVNALADSIVCRCSETSSVADGRAQLSGSELVREATVQASRIRALTDRPGLLVGVTLPVSVEAVVNLVASIIGDYSICFLDPSMDPFRRNAILDSVKPDILLDAEGVEVANASWDGRAGHEPGYVAMSSGSTGDEPKGVLSSWNSICAFAPFGAAALELDRTAIWAELTHPAYDMAMTNLLLALFSGASVRVSSTLGDRLRPLRFATRVGATHLRLAPRFIDLASAERRSGNTSIRVWGCGGDRLPERGILSAFSFGVPLVINTYGTSETIGFASAARFVQDAPVTSRRGIATIGDGAVGPWTTHLTERDGQSMLSVQSPHMPAGYLFGGGDKYPRWEGDALVVTGDIGVEEDGRLYCLGRSGRRIKRNARFVDLDEVDTVVMDASGKASFTIATPDGRLITMVETTPDDLDNWRKMLPSMLRPEVLPDDVVAVKQIPRLGNGKIDHSSAAIIAGEAIS